MRKLSNSHPTAQACAAGTPAWFRFTVGLLLAAFLTVGCGKTVGEAIDDTTITTRVKTAMLNDPAVGGLRIDVDTFKGAVTLSGRVKSQGEHDQALAIARGVNGVTEVKDALQIEP